MSERIALYPGSFDPIHYGHVDIAQRAARLFDRLIVGVYQHPSKMLLFTADERAALAREVLQPQSNIEVMTYSGLTVEFARQLGVQALVRGLRAISDFELEYQMALINQQLCADIDTVCLMTRQDYAFISASVVKEAFMAGGDVSSMVPPAVLQALIQRRKGLAEPQAAVSVVSIRD